MNSVAIPASSPSQALNSEGDLARAAARGDAEAFAELFRRHAQPAWRLAQAVAADRNGAATAFRDGFTRAVRSRRAAGTGAAMRPEVLAAVYKTAVEQALDRSTTPSVTRRAPDHDSALADAAFRSLPERWRAALWLSEVEGMDANRMAPILGVSSAVAGQLITRSRRGLAGRFAQARHEAPEHLGEVLRAAALTMPANLAEATRARWAAAGNERAPIFAPLSAWMEDHAARPISVAVGALVGLGLIGLGVVPQGSPVRSQLGASGAGSLGGAVPVQTCLGLPCSGTGGQATGGNGTVLTALGAGNPFGTATLTSSTAGTAGPGASAPAGSGAGGTAGPTGFGPSGSAVPASGSTGGTSGGGTTGGGSTGGGTSTGSGGTSTGSGGTGGGGGGGGTSPLPSPTTTLPPTVNLAPVATVSNTGSSLNVTLLPSSPASTTVTVPTSLTPSTTTTTAAPSTTTTTTPLSGVTNTVGGTLQGVTNTVTSTATTLLPGL